MYEVDFFGVGQKGRHGDAVIVRFSTSSGGVATVIIDAGFQDNGPEFVRHVKSYYGNDVDLAILSHPDADHIGGMGHVLRDLRVATFCVHRLGQRGGSTLPAAGVVDELIEIARARGTAIHEPFAGKHAFDGALQILGPTEDFFAGLVADQVAEESAGRTSRGSSGLAAALRSLGQWALEALPVEVPFEDGDGTSPRNNTSAITLITAGDRRLLFPADAGVPAIERALDWAQAHTLVAAQPHFIQMPHHGSRHNGSSNLLDRLLGPIGGNQSGTAFVNVAPEAKKHPSPRIANAFMRRGYPVYQTRGGSIRNHHDAGPRPGWNPIQPIGPLDESAEE